jgi:hypothetical protein
MRLLRRRIDGTLQPGQDPLGVVSWCRERQDAPRIWRLSAISVNFFYIAAGRGRSPREEAYD